VNVAGLASQPAVISACRRCEGEHDQRSNQKHATRFHSGPPIVSVGQSIPPVRGR
jgi:hypothetical protein